MCLCSPEAGQRAGNRAVGNFVSLVAGLLRSGVRGAAASLPPWPCGWSHTYTPPATPPTPAYGPAFLEDQIARTL